MVADIVVHGLETPVLIFMFFNSKLKPESFWTEW